MPRDLDHVTRLLDGCGEQIGDRQARDGVEVSRHLALNIGGCESRAQGRAWVCRDLPDRRKPPPQGARLHLRRSPKTLDHLAHAGLDDFYRGEHRREIAADLERVGSPVTRADLERCRATEAAPLSVAISAGTLWNTAPPTPGLMALMILALYDRLGVREAESFDHCTA